MWNKISNWMEKVFGPFQKGLGDWAESEHVHRDKFPLQPLNTFSNQSYLLSGLVLLAIYPSMLTLVISLFCLWLAIGSTLYHGWPNYTTRQLDHSGMYGVFGALLFTSLSLSWNIVLALGIVAAIAGYFLTIGTEYWVGTALIGTVIMSILGGSVYLTVFSLIVFLLSMCFWKVDGVRGFTGKYGHFAWHWGTGVGFMILGMSVLRSLGMY